MNKAAKDKSRNGLKVLVLFVVILLCGAVYGGDWPWWRGPNHNGISEETDWVASWPEGGPKVFWKATVGVGFSTISVSEGKAYTMGNAGDKDTVFCFDAATGKEIWKHTYNQRLDKSYYEGGTLASVTVADGRVYTVSKDGKAFCLDAESGKVLWRKAFIKDLGIERTTWGFSGSPLVIDNLVIYNAGATGLALNRDDGSVVWRGPKSPGGYATAVPYTMDGRKCVALFGFQEVLGLDVSTGEELWGHKWKTKYDVHAADPIIVGKQVFICSGYGEGCALLELESNDGKYKVKQLWRNRNMRNKMNASVLRDGYIYGVDEGGELRCLDFKTGEMLWQQPGFGQGSLMAADGKLIVLGEKGNLVIAQAGPHGYKEISAAKILPFKCWTVPVLANGRIYARNTTKTTGEVICLDVSK